jgi:hypothetical protein
VPASLTIGDFSRATHLSVKTLRHYHGIRLLEPADIDPDTDAAESAGRWRHRVAEWASEPSRPVPALAASAIRGAFDDDLDTVAALDLLCNLESRPDIAAGAKFETFLFVDRVLGLELPREIGR